MRKLVAILAVFGLFFLTACEEDSGAKASGQENEAKSRQSNFDVLTRGQPALTMDYSPTRETMNYWMEKWAEPGKLSFVYLMGGNGQIIGYYVLEGLPVSYCAALTPNYQFEKRDTGQYNGDMMVPAPGMDGAYYSGGQCNQYYAKDASTGAYVEFSIGGSLNYLLFDQPLPVEAEPLGFTTIEDAQDIQDSEG